MDSPSLKAFRLYMTEQLSRLALPAEQVSAEIRLILRKVAGITPEQAYLSPELPLDPALAQAMEALLRVRLETRAPIQYLLGEADFYGLTLTVTPAVLIPRPETEILVEKAVELARHHGWTSILDLCTGSGAIAMAIAHTLKCPVTATDISEAALAVAQANAERLGTPVTFYAGDFLTPVAGKRFELICCNPPYVDMKLRDSLAPEVRDHEPALALFPPEDELFYYRRLALESPRYLTPGGIILAELGAGQGEAVREIFWAQGFEETKTIPDYAGIPRVLVARWRNL